jgi:hypothetical protein
VFRTMTKFASFALASGLVFGASAQAQPSWMKKAGGTVAQGNPFHNGTIANRATNAGLDAGKTVLPSIPKPTPSNGAYIWNGESSAPGPIVHQQPQHKPKPVNPPQNQGNISIDKGWQTKVIKPAAPPVAPYQDPNQAGMQLATGIVNLVGAGIQSAQPQYQQPQYQQPQYQQPQYQPQYQQTQYQQPQYQPQYQQPQYQQPQYQQPQYQAPAVRPVAPSRPQFGLFRPR